MPLWSVIDCHFQWSENVGCVTEPCADGATCEDVTGGFQCLCPSGYTGEICDLGRYNQ